MLGQHYKVLDFGTNDDPKLASGYFVFSHDKSSVEGFFYKVAADSSEIVMFEPTEIDANNATVIRTFINPDQITKMLTEAIGDNKELMAMWLDVLEPPEIDESSDTSSEEFH